MTAEEYFGSWQRFIPTIEFSDITRRLANSGRPCCPAQKNVFRAFRECPLSELKVIMLGQDPYPQKDIATGLAFGNNSEPLSPSLEVIKEACIDYTIPHNPIHFDITLESWAKQGVLLLNSALTCELNKIGSHVMLWRPFMAEFLKRLSSEKPYLIYVLFGEQAQTFRPYIAKGSSVIEVKHPAYYARTNTKMPNIFAEINKQLLFTNGESIEWFTELN